jgi:hypothetical protein
MYKTEPMMPREEWAQFFTALVKCAGDEDEMEALCVPVREKMEKAGYKDFFSFLQACMRGEEW